MTTFPKELGEALFKAQGMMRGIAKDGTNPHYKSKYATLENVTDTIRPVLQECGVLFMQAPGMVDEHGVMQLATIFIHVKTGQKSETTIGVPLAKRDPQGIGSAITYACRYSLMALLGLPPVDDDGESAGRAETTTPAKVHNKTSDQAKELLAALTAELSQNKTEEDLRKWMKATSTVSRIAMLPVDWQDTLRTQLNDALSTFKASHAP